VRILHYLPLALLLLALLSMSQPTHAASIPNNALDPVTADLAAGRADDAISRLNLSLSAKPGDAEAHNLLCRVYYQEKRWDDAIHQCETAVQLAPLESGYHLWLGRAYGEKADAIHSINGLRSSQEGP
jgi:cytochrome c-type biogenesis protein CcmH/NrfG